MATKKTTKKASSEKLFEGYERREAKILAALKPYGIKTIEECRDICLKAGFDPYKIVEETQPICFENAKWASADLLRERQVGLHGGRRDGDQERLREGEGRRRRDRRRAPGVLHPRLRGGEPPGRPRTRQPGRDAP